MTPYKIYQKVSSNPPNALPVTYFEQTPGFALTSILYDGRALDGKEIQWLNFTIFRYPSVAFALSPQVTRSVMETLAEKILCPVTIRLMTADTLQIPEKWKGKIAHLIMENEGFLVCARMKHLTRLTVLKTESLFCLKCPQIATLEAFHTKKVKILNCDALEEMQLHHTEEMNWEAGDSFVKFDLPLGCLWNGKKIVEILEHGNGAHCLVHEN